MTMYILSGGLGQAVTYLIREWIGPAYLLVVAASAILLLKDRRIREFFSFLLLATLVSVLIYAGTWLVGENGLLTKTFKNAAEQALNTIVPFFWK